MLEPLYEFGIPSDEFSVGQIAQLHEIHRARIKRGEPGIGRHVQELIDRLKDGGVAGKSDDVRATQAKRLWDLGVGRELGYEKFADYLASIPEVKVATATRARQLGLRVVLGDYRIALKRLCELGRIKFGGDDNHFDSLDDAYIEAREARWFVMSNGLGNQGLSVTEAQRRFSGHERDLTAFEGVCGYLQDQDVIESQSGDNGHAMILSGSRLVVKQDNVALLRKDTGGVALTWLLESHDFLNCGVATRFVL